MTRIAISIMFYWTGFLVWVIAILTGAFCLAVLTIRLISELEYKKDAKTNNKQ